MTVMIVSSSGKRQIEIPDTWFLGFMQGHPGTRVGEAIAWWIQQEWLEDILLKED